MPKTKKQKYDGYATRNQEITTSKTEKNKLTLIGIRARQRIGHVCTSPLNRSSLLGSLLIALDANVPRRTTLVEQPLMSREISRNESAIAKVSTVIKLTGPRIF
ncbi:hypothetical protein K0M31_003241 [Melipona bicolor]|uniref:Uncharacterized protein n=1 Tax=Melipona bicolor TaxID=60889 RepID=A0AA40FYM0_9HYME|nr:hypothetical protein K0M31_003241 [Melipona bicolor]